MACCLDHLHLAAQFSRQVLSLSIRVRKIGIFCAHNDQHWRSHLAQTFHAFYHQVPVLQATDEALRDSRMELVRATAQVMQTGLGLLGIRVPERM